jgi:hypothetical protein
MTQLINREVRENIKSPLDFERFSQRFKTDNDLFTFPDPNLQTIEKNLYYLLRHSEEKKFESKYRYRPDYMSFDYYGTVILWQLLMYVNSVFSVEDFNLDVVIIPSLDAVTFILQDIFPIEKPQDLQSINW